jgi:hypothetical protein
VFGNLFTLKRFELNKIIPPDEMPPTVKAKKLKSKVVAMLTDHLKKDKSVLVVVDKRIEEKNLEITTMLKTKKAMKGVDFKTMYKEVIRMEDISKRLHASIDKKVSDLNELKNIELNGDVSEDDVIVKLEHDDKNEDVIIEEKHIDGTDLTEQQAA